MQRRTFRTSEGDIAYWVSRAEPPSDLDALAAPGAPWLVFLPGLTADHRLFDKQVGHFAGRANLLVWDAPSHGRSRPFPLTWSMDDLARWLHGILMSEGIERPVLVGQSLGGCISQAFMNLYQGEAAGFVSIDSFPLQRSYSKDWVIFFLKRTEPLFRLMPWKLLLDGSAAVNSTSAYGRMLMREMLSPYGRRGYAELAGHGFRAVADAIEEDRPYKIDCPALLICGDADGTGFVRKYNEQWEERAGYPVCWIAGAGHNSNCDDPKAVNAAIERFASEL